jgi:hypothetical protein
MAFPFLPLLLTLGGAGVTAALVKKPSPTGALPRSLQRFRWYRVRFKMATVPGSRLYTLVTDSQGRTSVLSSPVRVFNLFVPGSLIPFAILTHLKTLGFSAVAHSFADAQNGTTWDAFAFFQGPGPSDLAGAGVIAAEEILHVSPFAPSLPLLPWIGPYKLRVSNEPTSDGPMDPQLAETIAYAISHDDDLRRLRDFSISMLPEYPTASGELLAKRDTVYLAKKDRYTIAPVLALRPSDAMVKRTSPVANVGAFWDVVAAVATGGATEIIPVVADIVTSVVDAIASVGRDVLDVITTVAPFIQMGLSFIPGIGTVASAAIGAGIALAEGRPITDALIEAARGAFPGGPIAAKAVETAVRTIANLAQGQSLDVALVDGLRKSLSKTEQMAFDSAVALAQGKKIQDIALAGVGAISPAAGTVLTAIADGRSLDAGLLAQAGAAQAGLSPEARTAMSAVTTLAQKGSITEAAANAARSRLPPNARAPFDAALAIAQKRDPRQAIIQSHQNTSPNTPEAASAREMTRGALRGNPTPATLIGEAAKFIPNSPSNRNVNTATIPAAEALRISKQGTKAFAHPVLYLPDAERRKVEIEFEAKRIAAERAEAEEKERVRALLATPGAQKAVEWLKELFRLAELKKQKEEEAQRAALAQAMALRVQIRNSWIPLYANLKKVSERGGVPT